MKLLIPIENLKQLSSREEVPCECLNCLKTYRVPKNLVLRAIQGQKANKFCSKTCGFQYKTKTNTIECACQKCGATFKKKRHEKKKFCSHQCANDTLGNFKKKYSTCQNCNKEFYAKGNRKYCSTPCQQRLRNKICIEKWLNGTLLGYTGKTVMTKRFVREYVISKSNNQCSKCGWNKTHPTTGRIPLEVNHIDGNPKNCNPSNLEAICPNCHALTPNFRSLNKNSCRIRK